MSEKTIFVGDIHGDIWALEGVLRAHPEGDLVSLGDFADRGNQNLAVIDRMVQEMTRRSVTPLLGNHDAYLVEMGWHQNLDQKASCLRRFLNDGGESTLNAIMVETGHRRWKLQGALRNDWQGTNILENREEIASEVGEQIRTLFESRGWDQLYRQMQLVHQVNNRVFASHAPVQNRLVADQLIINDQYQAMWQSGDFTWYNGTIWDAVCN